MGDRCAKCGHLRGMHDDQQLEPASERGCLAKVGAGLNPKECTCIGFREPGYTFSVQLPSGRTIVLEGQAPEGITEDDRRFLSALDGQDFAANKVRHAGHASWRTADRAAVHAEAENTEPGRTPPAPDAPEGPKSGHVMSHK